MEPHFAVILILLSLNLGFTICIYFYPHGNEKLILKSLKKIAEFLSVKLEEELKIPVNPDEKKEATP